MSVQFLKPAGPHFATSQTDTPLKKIDKIPWYIYFLGAAIYTALAGWLFAESSPLGWFCLSARQWDFSMPGEPGKRRTSFNATSFKSGTHCTQP